MDSPNSDYHVVEHRRRAMHIEGKPTLGERWSYEFEATIERLEREGYRLRFTA